MVKYIIKRLLLALLILFGVSVLLYVLIRCMPANYLRDQFIQMRANYDSIDTPEEAEKLLKEQLAPYGLDDNSAWGIFKGYFMWLGRFLQGDMGVSFQHQGAPVQDVIGQYMWLSFGISFVALLLEMAIAIPLGVKCAVNQYGKLDYVATVLCMVGIAFPSFFLGNLFIKWFAVDLGWFETHGLTSGVMGTEFEIFLDKIWHLILPMTVMVLLSIGGLMRYTRTNTLEVLNADYIRTARAKGLSERKVIYKHVFRNTMIPLVTQLSFTLPTLFGGAMITEQVFDLPGIGNIAYKALLNGDVFLAMGYNMFLAVLTVIGVLFADIMYAVVDPRVKLGK
ncbi:MAG: ABC transporter permease [Clostridia bacterium]|nr:ABC transporter permease [Clostridia bacterium]MDE7257520.1 ABC transporter permease [Clostridia bacterium]